MMRTALVFLVGFSAFVLPPALVADDASAPSASCRCLSSEIGSEPFLSEPMKEKGCGDADRLFVLVEIHEFVEDAAYLDFLDGYSASYDGTTVRIREPVEHKGKTFHIYHDKSPPPHSPWRLIGSTHCLIVPISAFDDSSLMVFSNAVTIVNSEEE